MQYRHELKFLISGQDVARIDGRLSGLIPLDSHMENGCYTVRSLYFDDIYDSCLQEVISGVDMRRKFRIRLYNGSTDRICLEKKSKCRGMTRKDSQTVTVDDCLAYLDGLPVFGEGPVAQELFVATMQTGMVPKCIVEYERRAYVASEGNVRVTLDMDIRGTDDIGQFLQRECHDPAYVLPQGQHILEVKYDEFLPEYILQALDLNTLQRTSFSKYAWVRGAQR